LLEDTKITKKDLENKFGEHISNMVECVSGFGENRKEKQQNIKSKMTLYTASIDLKMADRLANMRNSKIEKPKLYNLYCKEHEDLKIIFILGNQQLFSEIEKVAEIPKPKRGMHA
jgi:(p)ppGpp synthase/HD superfamily hydrolase